MKNQITAFVKGLDLKFPIIQAPMAGASTVELAAIITKAGGLGSIPLGGSSESPQTIESQVSKFQQLVADESLKRNVNLNFFTHEAPKSDKFVERQWVKKFQKFYQKEGIELTEGAEKLVSPYPTFKSIDDVNHETVKLLIKLKPKVISFHFGLPNQKVLEILQESGIKIFITATNLEEFKQIVEAGADGVVLQGWEAGGHRGNFIANNVFDDKLSTEELVERVVDYIDSENAKFQAGEKAPLLIAAGGLYNGETISNVLNHGIAGVQLGTVWLPTKQATISEDHRKLFTATPARGTIMSPAISGRNLRTIETDYLKKLSHESPLESVPDYPLPYSILKQLAADAKKAGTSHSYSAFLAGSNYHESSRDTDDAKEVFEQLIDEIGTHGFLFRKYL